MKKIYTGDIGVIKEELINLRKKLENTKNVGEEYACLGNIYGLNEMYSFIDGKDFLDFDKLTEDYKKKSDRANRFSDDNENDMCIKFIENKKLYKYLGCYGHNTIVDAMADDKYSTIVQDFDEKEAYEIISDFLKCYHPENLEYFNYLIDNQRFININSFEKLQANIKGQCHFIYESLPLIIVESPFFSLESISRIIHEFGHAVDLKYLEKRYSIFDMEKSFFQSIKGEVIPRFYEREALSFFEKEGYDNKCTACLLDDYYGILEEVLLEVYFFSLLSNELLFNSNYYDVKKRKLLSKIDVKELRKVFKKEISFEYLDLSTSLKYSVGGLGGIMLYEEFSKNIFLGKEVLNRFLTSRVEFADEKFMLDLGFSIDKLEEVVEKDYQFIKKYRK